MKIFSILQTCKLEFKPLMAMSLAVFLLASCAKENGNVGSQTQESKQEVELRSDLCDDYQYCTTIINPQYFDRILVVQGCSIKVKYWVIKCFDEVRNQNVIKFFDLEIKVGQSTACSALLPTLPAGQEIQYNALLNAIHKKVQDQIEAEYMETQFPSGTQNVVQWLETSCFMYCTRVISEVDGIQWLEINSVKCGKSCCKRVTPWTRGPGDVWVKGETVVEGDPLCSAMATPQTCLGKGTSIGICNIACARM